MAVDHSGHRERMRTRAQEEGIMNFPPHEFLEILLYPLIPYKDTNAIAHELIDTFGSLENVFEVGYGNLMKVKGMTRNASFYISMIPDIARRYSICKLDAKYVFSTTGDLVRYLQPYLSTLTKEKFYVMTLNAQCALLSIKCLAEGVVNEAYVHVRSIVEEAILRNATQVVVAHNHPAGTTKPSRADIRMTENIMTALDSIDVTLVDHIIIAGNNYFSFSRHGGFDLLYRDDIDIDSDDD